MRVMAHAHWTMGKSKMSKSKGNVVDPLEALDKWGVDGVRWYLMRVGGSLADDAGRSLTLFAISPYHSTAVSQHCSIAVMRSRACADTC